MSYAVSELHATHRTQNAALIANAYARLQRNHTALLGHLSRELTCVPAAAFVGSGGAKDLSNLLNSYARLEYRDAAFFAHLAGAARRLHATKALFGAQAIANIMNAAVRLGFAAEEPGQDLVLAMAQACMHVRVYAAYACLMSLSCLTSCWRWRRPACTSAPPPSTPRR